MKTTNNHFRGQRSSSRKRSLLLLVAALITLMGACASEEETEATCSTGNSDTILARVESSDYSTYKIDLVNKDGTVTNDAITVNPSGGIKSMKYFTDKSGRTRLIIMNSRSDATGFLGVYNPDSFSTAENTLSVSNFGQEIAFSGCRIFFAVQNENKVKTLDLSDVTSLGTPTEIDVGKKPTNVRNINGKIYVTNQDFTDKTNPSVSIINPDTLTVEKTVKVGNNVADLAYLNGSVFSFNGGYCDWDGSKCVYNSTSISYDINSTNDTATAPTVSMASASNSENPQFGGGLAVVGGTLYALLRNGTDPRFRYIITTAGVSDRDDNGGLNYEWIGSHSTTLYKAYIESSNYKVSGGSLTSVVNFGTKQSDETLFILE